jgi:hypothetical protein
MNIVFCNIIQFNHFLVVGCIYYVTLSIFISPDHPVSHCLRGAEDRWERPEKGVRIVYFFLFEIEHVDVVIFSKLFFKIFFI